MVSVFFDSLDLLLLREHLPLRPLEVSKMANSIGHFAIGAWYAAEASCFLQTTASASL